MLIRLIYVSRAAGPQTRALTEVILEQARASNARNEISGVLCEGQGVFLQVLEGERGTVSRLYARIFADPRHQDLELIHCESITQRRYGDWAMARVDLSDVEPQSEFVWPELDPYSPGGLQIMSRIDALVARGHVVEAPASSARP